MIQVGDWMVGLVSDCPLVCTCLCCCWLGVSGNILCGFVAGCGGVVTRFTNLALCGGWDGCGCRDGLCENRLLGY